jgi:hypothetical protein
MLALEEEIEMAIIPKFMLYYLCSFVSFNIFYCGDLLYFYARRKFKIIILGNFTRVYQETFGVLAFFGGIKTQMESSHKEKLKNGKTSKYTNDSLAVTPPAFQIICSISDNTTKFTRKASGHVLKWKKNNVLSYTRRKIKSNRRVMRLTIFEKSCKTKRNAHPSEKDKTTSI